MSRPRIAHRAEFSVRCACGIAYNTDDAHIGKQIKCRCGRTVAIVRPAEALGAPGSNATKQNAGASMRRRLERMNRRVKRWLVDAFQR